MIKIVLILAILFTSVFSKKIIDGLRISAYDSGKYISVNCSTRTHYEGSYSSKKRKSTTYICNAYNYKTGFFLASVKEVDRSSLKINIDDTDRQKIDKIRVECSVRYDGKSKSAETKLTLRKPYTSSYNRTQYTNTKIKASSNLPKFQEVYTNAKVVKTKAEIEKENKIKYVNAANIFIDNLHIYGVKEVSYRDNKKTHVVIKAATRNYLIPIIKLKKAKLYNLPSDIKKKLENMVGTEFISTKEVVVKNQKSDILTLLKSAKKVKIDKSRWLFIIAIENYEYTNPVKYSSNSAKELKKVMQKRFGILDKHIKVLIDKDATSGKIRHNFNDMLRHVKKGDTIYFYYSGHGIPVPSQKYEAYMLAQDMSPQYVSDDSRFKLQNIYKALSDSKADKVIAFVDSCFSGGADNQSLVKGVAATRMVPKKVTFKKNKMLVISAGSGTQYSNKYDKKQNRLFSYYIMRGLIKNNTNISRLYDYVRSNVAEKSYEMGDIYEQIPVYDGNLKLKL